MRLSTSRTRRKRANKETSEGVEVVDRQEAITVAEEVLREGEGEEEVVVVVVAAATVEVVEGEAGEGVNDIGCVMESVPMRLCDLGNEDVSTS